MPVLFAADPPLPFNLKNRMALLTKIVASDNPIYSNYFIVEYIWPGQPHNLDLITRRVRPQEERGRTKTSRSLQGTNTRLQDEPDKSNKSIHLVIFFTARIYFSTKLHDFIFLLHEYYACHDQHEHH